MSSMQELPATSWITQSELPLVMVQPVTATVGAEVGWAVGAEVGWAVGAGVAANAQTLNPAYIPDPSVSNLKDVVPLTSSVAGNARVDHVGPQYFVAPLT